MLSRRFLLLFLALFALSCSRADQLVTAPTTPGLPARTPSDLSSHYLWAYYAIEIDPVANTYEMLPVRQTEDHWNILKFLEKGPCKNCVKILSLTDSGNDTKLIDIQIVHPFTGANFTGFDVRGIAIFQGSLLFPEADLTAPDRTQGDGELVNADGYTTLYNAATAGKGPGGLQGYFPGKFSSSQAPNATLNGYKRHISADPDNTRNAFYPGDALTVTYEIHMPDTTKIMGYAVDASWAPPTKIPVVDPMKDFPPEANCPEPWQVSVFELPGKGLTEGGGNTVLSIDVYDHQGKYSHLPPRVECPGVFQGVRIASWIADTEDHSSYQVTIFNEELAQPGNYPCLISVEDTENAISPEWLDLTAYQMIALTVIRSGWARTWGGTDIDTAASVGVDASGFIYVTGIFYGTVDFDPGPGIQEITGAGSLDCYLSKFDTSGRLVWVRTWGGAFWDQPTDLALDESGNIYVTGYFSDTVDFDPGPDLTEISSHGDWDCFVSKFNPNGDFQWVRTWGDGYWDMSMGIAVDDTSFYVTGEFRGVVDFDPGPGVTEYNAVPGASFLSRFDTSGNFKWARAWSGDGGYDDEGMAVAARGGSIYVTGVFDGKCDFDPGSGKDEHTSFNYYQDIYLSKFVANGDFQWAWTWGGEVDDWPGGAAIDSAGNVYVTGRYGATVDFDPGPGVDNRTSNGERDAFLTTFAPDGTYRWANTWGGSSGGFWDLGDDASDVFIDGTYTIYVCGYFNGTVDFDPGPGIAELTTNGSEDAFIQVLDPTGAYLWARSWGGQGIDHAYGVAVDSLGNSYVCGDFTSSADFDPGPWVDEHFSDGKDGSFLTKFLPDGVW